MPVIVRDIGDPLEAERILIESNRQRAKTPSERMHEADNLTRIFAEEARKAMLAGVTEDGAGGRGKRVNPLPTLAEGLPDRRTDTQAAEAVGMKQRTYAKVKYVHDTANDKTVPEPVRAVAQQQMAALDAGDTTPVVPNLAQRAWQDARQDSRCALRCGASPTMLEIVRRGFAQPSRLTRCTRGRYAHTSPHAAGSPAHLVSLV